MSEPDVRAEQHVTAFAVGQPPGEPGTSVAAWSEATVVGQGTPAYEIDTRGAELSGTDEFGPAGEEAAQPAEPVQPFDADALMPLLEALRDELAAVRAEAARSRDEIQALTAKVVEVARLRSHDAELADRMHAEIVRLRSGELSTALAPLLGQLLRLHDRMVDLAAADRDDAQVTDMLRTQLLQILDTSADVHSYEPPPGEPFDPIRHQGVGRVPTGERDTDGSVARTVRPGFARSDGSVVRVAEVEVFRYDPALVSNGSATPDAVVE